MNTHTKDPERNMNVADDMSDIPRCSLFVRTVPLVMVKEHARLILEPLRHFLAPDEWGGSRGIRGDFIEGS